MQDSVGSDRAWGGDVASLVRFLTNTLAVPRQSYAEDRYYEDRGLKLLRWDLWDTEAKLKIQQCGISYVSWYRADRV